MVYAGNTGGSGSMVWLKNLAEQMKEGIPGIGPIKREQPSGILSAQGFDLARRSNKKIAPVQAKCSKDPI